MKKIIFTLLIHLSFQTSYGQAEFQEPFAQAVKFLQSENYKKAVKQFSDILAKATDNQLKKTCYIYRAFSYNGLNQSDKAISDFDKAIELDPVDLASYTDRGKTKASIKDLDGAIKDFNYILSKDSVSDQGQAAFYYLGKVSFIQGKFSQSINYYDKLLRLAPKDFEAYFDRAAAKGMMMNLEGSIQDYDMAIKLKPDYTNAYANRGVAKINLLTSKGNIKPTGEQTADACQDLETAKQMGDKTVDDMIFLYCHKK